MHPILDRIERHAVERPQHAAACDQSLILDYASLQAIACGLAGHIDAASRAPHVGILAPASAAGAVSILACWSAGRVPVPLNFLLAPEELAKVVRDAGLDCVVTVEPFAPAVERLGLRALVLSGNKTLVPGRRAAPAVSLDDLGALIYTSGTSGDPKGVCLSFGNLARNVDASIRHIHLRDDEVFLGIIPQFHGFGFTATTLIPLMLGATVHYLPRFTPLMVAETCRERGVTIFIAVASMFGALVQARSLEARDFASLRYPISGGEPLPMRVAALFEERFGKRLLEGYGMTEASPIVSVNTPEAYRLGSVGPALPGIEVGAIDPMGAPLPPGEEGQLAIRGHCVMQGYLNKPEATASAIRNGWLWTGDVGRVSTDGFICITGRAKDMLIVGGENVYPIEIERVLADAPGVAEVAVIGVRDDLRGEVPVAFVVPAADGPPPEELPLREFCRERLASYKVPRQVVIRADLPRGPTGKILKRALQAPDK